MREELLINYEDISAISEIRKELKTERNQYYRKDVISFVLSAA